MFPTIYGIALEGIGQEDAKIAASGPITAILGGALITPLQALVSDCAGAAVSFVVPLVCFAVILVYLRNKPRRLNQNKMKMLAGNACSCPVAMICSTAATWRSSKRLRRMASFYVGIGSDRPSSGSQAQEDRVFGARTPLYGKGNTLCRRRFHQ